MPRLESVLKNYKGDHYKVHASPVALWLSTHTSSICTICHMHHASPFALQMKGKDISSWSFERALHCVFTVDNELPTKFDGLSSDGKLAKKYQGSMRIEYMHLKDTTTPNYHQIKFHICAERRHGWHINNIFLVTMLLGFFGGTSAMMHWDEVHIWKPPRFRGTLRQVADRVFDAQVEARLNMILVVVLTFIVYKTWIADRIPNTDEVMPCADCSSVMACSAACPHSPLASRTHMHMHIKFGTCWP